MRQTLCIARGVVAPDGLWSSLDATRRRRRRDRPIEECEQQVAQSRTRVGGRRAGAVHRILQFPPTRSLGCSTNVAARPSGLFAALAWRPVAIGRRPPSDVGSDVRRAGPLVHLSEVVVELDECFIVGGHRRNGARPLASPQLARHVNGVATEDGPLKDVGPRQRVSRERARKLDHEGRSADGFSDEETYENAERFLRLRLHQWKQYKVVPSSLSTGMRSAITS